MSFQLLEMDTDSMYMALTGKSVEAMIKPEMRAQFEREKNQWFVDSSTPEREAYSRRTPGLFKIEANQIYLSTGVESNPLFSRFAISSREDP